MLGIDWLIENGASWDFVRGEVCIEGVKHRLAAGRTRGNWCRRVMLADDVTIPPHSQLDVLTDTLYCQLHTVPKPVIPTNEEKQKIAGHFGVRHY